MTSVHFISLVVVLVMCRTTNGTPTTATTLKHSTGMGHSGMNHTVMPGMNHSGMNHSGMNHSGINHSGMNHSSMNHSGMGHSGMDHSGMGPSGGSHSGHGSVGHNLYFYFGHKGVIVLFYEWRIDSVAALIGSCIGVFAIAMLYEGLKVWREMLTVRADDSRKAASHNMKQLTNRKDANTLGVDFMPGETLPTKTRHQICNCMHALQSLLHIVQVLISYGLMLVFMTFNVWLCLSVALGAGAGYFAFGWRRPITVDRNEHCH
ncbi:PREDICTED: high affinity copper uptake protein 1-like isoform X4 [Branchiostoma belcheri]|uniref:Copper transport protein n=1 Tax=Branchiostoma belcheri TaxID=7741 RepID=A0A6P4YKU1_BRABE|nr:PREDICTED: high affinity copper uptake protein 1-like isoform X4 [Branchiostoma belcheri]XP_019619324.1 PREDICTED: high affinity copper uptake protein 1-like isoform X4 [Branchiostoma belcheri]